MEQQVVRRHGPTGEEGLGHPVAWILRLELVGELAVAKDVHEQHPSWSEPGRDPGHQPFIVFHVLEHLDGEHTIKAPMGFKLAHIRHACLDVGQAPRPSLRFDIRLLCPRIRDGHDLAVRVLFGDPQAQRAPAAAQIQHLHPIFKLCPFTGEVKHGLFGLVQIADSLRPIATTVLEPLAQDKLKELAGHLVVLAIRRLCLDSNGALP